MQIAPSQEVSHLVRHYLIYHPGSYKGPMRFFTDGSPGIIIPKEDSALPYFPDGPGKMGELLVYGIFDKYIDIPALDCSGMIIAVLQPYALAVLTSLNASKLKNRIFHFSDLFPAYDAIKAMNNKAGNCNGIIAEFEDFLTQIQNKSILADKIVSGCIDLIRLHHGNIRGKELLRHLPTTERQLQRRFHYEIGISPKQFSGILRMTHFLKLLRSSGHDHSPTRCALHAGYYDQAHLNNHFRAMTGTTPLSYLSGADPLALNLFCH
ncbi:helix-turn-helix domain-containing protein [Desertivirga xinjiangensis]|uniref:helix-turn-helix domain-containing protein n=1 Tax=Desertivirga xinjiangensis TaxID=539206 RepID=UPI002109FAB2|nr:helix-turn-helix domain-containing protein [Pedobacter xinjiangensis]